MPVVVPYVSSTKAPTHAGRFRSGSPLGIGAAAGGEFLNELFPAGRQIVEAAFGADPNGDPAQWGWQDITRYVQWTPGVYTRIGYPNESLGLVPAEFTGVLRNDQDNGGDFTQDNVLSRWYPYVRENTPIRASLDIGAGAVIRFQGYATNWGPIRNAAGALNLVKLDAHGVSRRIKQGQGAKFSAMRRAFNADIGTSRSPVAYWSLEGGRGSTVTYDIMNNLPSSVGTFASVSSGEAGGTQFGAAELGDGSDLVANIAGGWNIDLTVPTDTVSTGAATLQFSMAFGTTVRSSSASKCGLRFNAGTNPKHLNFDVIIADNGVLALEWFEADNAFNLTAGPTNVLSVAAENIFDGQPRQFQLDLVASGGTNVAWTLYRNDEQVGSGTITPSFSGAMNAPPFRSASFSSAPASEVVALGHVAVYNHNPSVNRYQPLIGWRGETVTDRLSRLCDELGVDLQLFGTSDMAMGPQGIESGYALLQEPPRSDGGILLDGLGPGFTYIARTYAYSRDAPLTLDASGGGDVLGPLTAQPDDASRVNDFTATNGDGIERRFVQHDGPRGIDAVGTYDRGGRFSIDTGEDLYQRAAWEVAQGTAKPLRFPRLEFELAKPSTSLKAQAWLSTQPFDRIEVLGISPGTIEVDRSFLLRGWSERWTRRTWRVTVHITDYGPFAVLMLAPDTGSGDDPLLGWLDTDGSTVATGMLATETLSDGFEGGISAWGAQNGWTLAADTAQVRTGTTALKLTPPGATASGGAATNSGTPATAGMTYVARAWFYSAAGWSDCRAAVDWYNASNVFISSSLGSATSVPAGVWTLSQQQFIAPAGTVTGRLRARQGGTPAASDVLWVDDMIFAPVLIVLTPSGPLWTNSSTPSPTYADDLDGLHINVDGMRLQVLAIEGATSPQTFVFDPAGLLRAVSAGAPVSVWSPPVLGL